MKAFLPSLGVCALLMWGVSAWADTKPNESVIGLLAAEPQWLSVASTIATKLDHENGLRIVPMLGVGGVHGLQDLASMPMVDAAIVASDSLNYAVLQNILNGKQDQFSYVARLATLDVVSYQSAASTMLRSWPENGLPQALHKVLPLPLASYCSMRSTFHSPELPSKIKMPLMH